MAGSTLRRSRKVCLRCLSTNDANHRIFEPSRDASWRTCHHTQLEHFFEPFRYPENQAQKMSTSESRQQMTEREVHSNKQVPESEPVGTKSGWVGLKCFFDALCLIARQAMKRTEAW